MDLPTYKTFTSFKKLHPKDRSLLCNDMGYGETVEPITVVSNGLNPYSCKLGHHRNVTDTTSSLSSESEVLYHQLYGLNTYDAYTYSYDDILPYSSTRITTHSHLNSASIYDVYSYSYDDTTSSSL